MAANAEWRGSAPLLAGRDHGACAGSGRSARRRQLSRRRRQQLLQPRAAAARRPTAQRRSTDAAQRHAASRPERALRQPRPAMAATARAIRSDRARSAASSARWLGSMLFPHWGMGYGGRRHDRLGLHLAAPASALIWFVFRHVPRPRLGMRLSGCGGGLDGRGGLGDGSSGMSAAQRRAIGAAARQIGGASDYQAFEAILKDVQAAWSDGDLAELRRSRRPRCCPISPSSSPRTKARASSTRSSRSNWSTATCARPGTKGACSTRPPAALARARLHRAQRRRSATGEVIVRRSAAPDRGGRDLDLRAQPRRTLAAVGDPAGVTRRREL